LDGNPDDLTALHWAAASGVVEAVNYRGERPADTASRTGKAEAVRVLEARDAEPS
jgi:ankyrin repeat protein